MGNMDNKEIEEIINSLITHISQDIDLQILINWQALLENGEYVMRITQWFQFK
jgi:hypothetical protein